jgi:regulator of protease activity HflC (stomatin/prohibitin superfamily)
MTQKYVFYRKFGLIPTIGFIGALLTFLLLMASWQTIRPGYVGIVFDKVAHKVTSSSLEPGWAFINPFTQAMREYPVTIITYSMVQRSSEGRVVGDDSIKIQSSEGQQLNLDVVIQYQVIKDEAPQLYTDWGGAMIELVEDGLVRQYTRTQVPIVASRFSWEQITSSKRDEVVREVSRILTEEFGRRHLKMVSFGIREAHLPNSLQAALDQKIQAQQLAEQQHYQLKQAEIKAQQDVAEATGKANALKTLADGEATALLTNSRAKAEANEKLSNTLSSELLHYEQLQKWDGKLPLIVGATTPLMDVKGLIKDTINSTETKNNK